MSMANGVKEVDMSGHHEVKKQRSMKFSLYPGRPRTATTTTTNPEMPQSTSPISALAPQLPPLPLPRRSDSLVNRNASARPYTSHHPPSESPRSFTSPPQLPPSLRERPSEASRLRALNNGYRSHSSDGRQTPESLHSQSQAPSDNFSRPRQPSLRRRNESPKPLHGSATFPLQSHHEEQIHSSPNNASTTRDRGLSTSSSQSTTNFSSIPLRPSTSIPDYHSADSIHSRTRNLNSSGYRPSRGMSRPDSNYSAHRREPISRPTGFDGEEVRASFRSALTTNSSFLGTSGTERSSVLTKSSSATSVFGKDEGMSVDDFLGMYEGGFTDSGVEDTRPGTASSEQKRISALCEAMNDSLIVPPNVTIRDSAAMFSGSAMGTPSPSDMETPGSMDRGSERRYFDPRPPLNEEPLPESTPLEFDETRDRYGFRKKTQHVSLADYEAWNGPYTEYLARRRKKWVALLKENGLMTDQPNRFPAKSTKVKRFVRKGIPPDWRGDAWFYYAGGPAMLSQHYGVYDDLIRRVSLGGVSETDDEIIERDLNRTFPDNIRFKPDASPSNSNPSNPTEPIIETPILQSLRRVLRAFAIYNPRIGYCQSLNFLAGLLLLFMPEERAFWMLNIITRIYLPGTHELNLEGANVDLGVLMISVKESMPTIWTKIAGELDGTSTFDPKLSMRLPPITLCTTAWFMSCFIGTLPIETTLRVWDSFFYEGSKTLFRIALTIFKLGEPEIKAVTDPMEIFQVVQTIPRRLVDASLVLDTCFKKRGGFAGLSQEKIENRRAERRKGYADERARAAKVANGEVVDVKRKGTVFGRRRVREAVIT